MADIYERAAKAAADNFDLMAQAVFLAALREKRAGELMEALLDGGSATIDPDGKLVVMLGSQLAHLIGD